MFSASRTACSEISFLLLFLFIAFFQMPPDRTYVDDEIGQCSEDTEHLRAVDDRLGRARLRHTGMV
jgi:hypothetical protein